MKIKFALMLFLSLTAPLKASLYLKTPIMPIGKHNKELIKKLNVAKLHQVLLNQDNPPNLFLKDLLRLYAEALKTSTPEDFQEKLRLYLEAFQEISSLMISDIDEAINNKQKISLQTRINLRYATAVMFPFSKNGIDFIEPMIKIADQYNCKNLLDLMDQFQNVNEALIETLQNADFQERIKAKLDAIVTKKELEAAQGNVDVDHEEEEKLKEKFQKYGSLPYLLTTNISLD